MKKPSQLKGKGIKKKDKEYPGENKKASFGSGQGKKLGWSGVAADMDTMSKRKGKFKKLTGKGKAKGKGKKKGGSKK
jgi:hypothetical protein